jgi:hypothetical protein
MSDEELPDEGQRRYITEQDIDICMLNPKKHELNETVLKSVYAVGNSDKWHCTNCKDRGDKWAMMVHWCKFVYKFHYNSKAMKKHNEEEKRNKDERLD